MAAGFFITFEGIDGAGKSSHIAPLAESLRAQGHTVTVTREPGGTALAEKLRTLLLHNDMDALTEALLVFAARRDHLRCVIEPALARGEVVLCDRFTDATFAYQGAGRGFHSQILAQLEQWVQTSDTLPEGQIRQPDITLWFDLPPQVAAARLADARQPDRFEALQQDFFARVAQGYAERAAQAPERFVRLDAAQLPEVVWQQLTTALACRGWLAAVPQP